MKASSAAIDCCRFLFLSSTSFFWGSSYFFFTHRRILGRRLKSDAINQRATSLRFRSTKCLSAVNDQLFSSVHLVVSLFLFFSLFFCTLSFHLLLFSSSNLAFLPPRPLILFSSSSSRPSTKVALDRLALDDLKIESMAHRRRLFSTTDAVLGLLRVAFFGCCCFFFAWKPDSEDVAGITYGSRRVLLQEAGG